MLFHRRNVIARRVPQNILPTAIFHHEITVYRSPSVTVHSIQSFVVVSAENDCENFSKNVCITKYSAESKIFKPSNRIASILNFIHKHLKTSETFNVDDENTNCTALRLPDTILQPISTYQSHKSQKFLNVLWDDSSTGCFIGTLSNRSQLIVCANMFAIWKYVDTLFDIILRASSNHLCGRIHLLFQLSLSLSVLLSLDWANMYK